MSTTIRTSSENQMNQIRRFIKKNKINSSMEQALRNFAQLKYNSSYFPEEGPEEQAFLLQTKETENLKKTLK